MSLTTLDLHMPTTGGRYTYCPWKYYHVYIECSFYHDMSMTYGWMFKKVYFTPLNFISLHIPSTEGTYTTVPGNTMTFALSSVAFMTYGWMSALC